MFNLKSILSLAIVVCAVFGGSVVADAKSKKKEVVVAPTTGDQVIYYQHGPEN